MCKDIRQRIPQRESKSWGARNEVFQLQKENLVGMISVCRVNSVGKLRQESDSCLSFPTELTLHTLIIPTKFSFCNWNTSFLAPQLFDSLCGILCLMSLHILLLLPFPMNVSSHYILFSFTKITSSLGDLVGLMVDGQSIGLVQLGKPLLLRRLLQLTVVIDFCPLRR